MFPDRELSFRSVLEPIASVAAALRDEYGVRKGDRVAIAAANCVEYAITFWAATALGALTVALNGWWTGPEMSYALELTTPRVLLGDERRLARVDASAVGCPVVVFERDFAALESVPRPAELPTNAIDEDDPFLILFTSGTTGRPKGVVLSHRSNIHFLQASMLRGAENMLRAQEPGAPSPDAGAPPCVISASPMFHVSGLNCQLVASTLSGMTIVYQPPGKWREDVHLELTERHRATLWSLVPTQLWRLLDWPDLDRYDLSSLTMIGGGSAVWPPDLLRTVEARLPWVRPKLGTGYGMTETNGLGTSLSPASTFVHPDSIGQAAPTVDVELRDEITGKVVPEGEVGEICMRGAATFLEYWDNPDATRAVLDDDRWYHSGDFGRARDGFVYLEGRRQDLIIRGGENISPIEIENRLIEHPDIVEVAVVGIEHPTLGQEVAAFVVPRRPSVLSADHVREWAADTLAPFKVPTRVELRDSLEHNASGKVLKHVLTRPEQASGFIED